MRYLYGTYVGWLQGTNSTLVITNVQNADRGYYCVVVTNVDGAITSAVATLTVLLPPTIAKVTPTNSSVSLGANLTVQVTASGTLPLGYQWCLNATALSGQANGTLSLTNVQLADAGAYTVVVTNIAGAATSGVATLTVDATFTKITTGDVVSGSNSWGQAWGDLDNDGYLDLVVLRFGFPPTFYHNNHDGTFSKIAAGSLPSLGTQPNNTTITIGDFNNDGYLDLFFGQFTSGLLELCENEGNGTFTNVAKVSNMMYGQVNNPGGAGWVDYNNDGWLDLFIGDSTGTSARGSVLFKNNGDGSFSAVTSSSLAGTGNGVNAAAWADYDNDGHPDLFVTATPGSSALYHNNGDGTFTRTTNGPVSGGTTSTGCAWGDYNNEGFPDLFVANGASGLARNFLYHNEGNGTFTKVTQGGLVTTPMDSYGCAWGDYDNDGFLDLLVINGYDSGATTNSLYHNNGDGTFTAVSLGSLTSDLGAYASCGWADYDNDGFLDLFVANANGKNVLYRNNGNSNSWLEVQCVGRASNRAGIGAKVRVNAFYRGASRRQLRKIFGGDGWGNSQPLLAHFGLGDATNVDLVQIEWPSGIVQQLTNVAPRQFLTITEHQAGATTPPSLVALRTTNGTMQLSVTGQTNLLCAIEASTDLVQWTKIAVRTNLTGTVQFTPPASSAPRQFYRVVVP